MTHVHTFYIPSPNGPTSEAQREVAIMIACPRCIKGKMVLQGEVVGTPHVIRCVNCGHRDERDVTSRYTQASPPSTWFRRRAKPRREKQCACGKFISLSAGECNGCRVRDRIWGEADRRCRDCGHTWAIQGPSTDRRICHRCKNRNVEVIGDVSEKKAAETVDVLS